jgi:chemotaxis protein MotB
MADEKAPKTIIIYKKRKNKHAHHGGAWKVAFADFMTAMFALFLVLWILTQSQEVKEAVASYFRHPTDYEGKPDVLLRGNEGLMDHKQGRMDMDRAVIDMETAGNKQPGDAGGQPGQTPTSITGGKGLLSPPEGMRPKIISKVEDIDEVRTFLELADKLWEVLGTTSSFHRIKDNLLIQSLEDGLLIQLLEQEKSPLFEDGQDVFKPGISQALAVIAKQLSTLPNKLEIDGHGKSLTNFYNEKQKWVASTYIADVTRAEMERNGLKSQQIIRISGCADTRPMGSGVGRRISILVRPRQWQERY